MFRYNVRAAYSALPYLAVCIAMLVLIVRSAHAEGPRSVAPLVKKLAPAVVNISTSQKIEGSSRRTLPSVPEGSPFEDLFDDFFENEDGTDGRRKVASLGSGFVVDGVEGLVVTNNHVIDGADEIEVNFSDGRKLKVQEVLGVDKKTDLALLKVKPDRPLPAVKFGRSEVIEVGDWVLAIGNPFGLGGSVSVGIISAKQRDIKTGPYDDYLQTDAAINKGNSGGPLFNMDGDVIGVNTAIISPTGGSIGIGFAVPASVANMVIDQLRRFGETRRGWLGVRIQSVTQDLADSLNVTADRGAFVASVTKGGPAEKAGINAGDIIISFDGKPINEMRTLLRLVAQTSEGTVAPVVVLRDGQQVTLDVEIGRLNEAGEGDDGENQQQRSDSSDQSGDLAQGPIAGLELSEMTAALSEQYKIDQDAEGLVVTNVEPDSQAALRGIKPGSRLILIGSTPITSRADLDAALREAKASDRRNVRLTLEMPDGKKTFLAYRVD